MNDSIHNNSCSYCKRHTYAGHSKASFERFRTPEKERKYMVDSTIQDHSVEETADVNVFKKTYNEFMSLVCDKKSINQMISKAATWLEVDDKSLRVEGVKKKIPTKLIVSIVVVATSLMLVVSGAVISSKANMELYAAENKLEELNARKAELDEAIELKNDLVYIEDVARNKLGMIDREYGTVTYVNRATDDKIEIYEKSNNSSAFSALLNALGFFEE